MLIHVTALAAYSKTDKPFYRRNAEQYIDPLGFAEVQKPGYSSAGSISWDARRMEEKQ